MLYFSDRPLSEKAWDAIETTLQQSQHMVDHARQTICPVHGFADPWSDLPKAHEAIKQACS